MKILKCVLGLGILASDKNASILNQWGCTRAVPLWVMQAWRSDHSKFSPQHVLLKVLMWKML